MLDGFIGFTVYLAGFSLLLLLLGMLERLGPARKRSGRAAGRTEPAVRSVKYRKVS